MSKKINSILKEVLDKIKPSKKELEEIEDSLGIFLKKFKKSMEDLGIEADIFIGGSSAKNTLIKKDYYDVDVFIRFPKERGEAISNLTEKILKNVSKYSVIHGSRDYFKIKATQNLIIELIPVIKVKNNKEAVNITDLSFFHVKYINKKIKSEITLDDIRLAKAFCYANKCYGAESYVQGFSGYGLELLVYYYKTFIKFIKAMAKIKGKTIIDIEKHYKNKQAVLMDLNSSKLHSPIILIDPTYKQRNALAALSQETFDRFKKECENFLKNPSEKSFEIKKTDLEKIKKEAEKKKYEFILLEADTNKQEGDVAGSKLLKFYKHFSSEIENFFEIKNRGFSYNGKKSARYFFVVKGKPGVLYSGPKLKDIKNVKAFKKKHKSTFVKSGRIYAKEKVDFKIGEFIENWKKKNKDKIKEMSIKELKFL
ncbi:tRNA nucleotidyltransferase, second domain [archaeon BMS3Abin17]|nr:tRNA nucleotidyltransferase, second domain [archaeon BMS3Abin17]